MAEEDKGLEAALDSAYEEASGQVEDVPESGNETSDAGEVTREASEKDAEEGSSPSPATTSEAEKPTDQDSEEEGADAALLKLTPEELAEIKKNPATAKLYKSVMRSATQKWQEIAEYRKLWDALQNDPENAIRALAAAKNITLGPNQPQKDAAQAEVDEVTEEMNRVLGPEAAALLQPVFEKLARKVMRGVVGPQQQAVQALQMDAKARQAQAQIAQFRASAKEKGWDITPDVEAKMTQIGQQLLPARPIETVDDGVRYLEMMYTLATAESRQKTASQEVLRRMQRAAESAEPTRGVPSGGQERHSKVTKEMSLDEAFDVAVEEAQAKFGSL